MKTFERFTDRALTVMQLAELEAKRLNQAYVGTEHILLGMLVEGRGVAAHAILSLGGDLATLRARVELMAAGKDQQVGDELALTPRALRVIEYVREECARLHHNYVGTEHLLLGLVRVEQCAAADVLAAVGLNRDALRNEVLNILGHGSV